MNNTLMTTVSATLTAALLSFASAQPASAPHTQAAATTAPHMHSAVNTALSSNPTAFINQSSVKPRLTTLLGLVNMRFLQKNFGVVSTLQNGGGSVAVTGCRPHDCPDNGSLVIYNQKRDAFKVWLTVSGKTRAFQEKGWVTPTTLNADTKAAIQQLGY